jgi:DNA-binding XRE family transcriptional regulator
MSETMQAVQEQEQRAPARPGRYVVVEGADGRRRVARADGKPLGTPFVRTTALPQRKVTARGFLSALRYRPTPAAVPVGPPAPTAEELRERRDALGIGQRELAAAVGISRGLLSELESGRRTAHAAARVRIGRTLARLEAGKRPEAPESDGLPRAEAGE